MNPPFSDKILLLLASKSMTRSRSLTMSPSYTQSPSPSPSTVTVQGSQGSNLLLVIAVPISVFAAILLAIIVIQAIYYNRQRIRDYRHQLTEVPLPAISMSPILTAQPQVFDANDPCTLEDPTFTTENPMHKNVAI